MTTKFTWTRISYDTNGNPRYVCHFLNLLTDTEKEKQYTSTERGAGYAIACKRANAIGGRKYNTKTYRGGIVFQAYECDLVVLESRIAEILAEAK